MVAKTKLPKELDFYTEEMTKKKFLEVIEKRIRKFIRLNELFKPNDTIVILHDNSPAAFVTEHVLRELSLKLPLKILIRKKLTKKILDTANKILFPINADDHIDAFLNTIYFDKLEELYKEEFLSIVRHVAEKECYVFCKYLGLGKGKIKLKKHELDIFDKPYHETKFATVKSIELMKDVI
jgi:hypothetical protein